MRVCFDVDFILFSAASIAQETFIKATHVPTGQVIELENISALWGHHKKKDGGWCSVQNKMSGNDFYKPADFEVENCQKLRPFRVKGKDGEPDTFLDPMAGAQKVVTDKINGICGKLKAQSYFGYTGRGKTFRHDVATLQPYKGVRPAAPLILNELKEWAVQNHNIVWVEGVEADDAVAMAVLDGYKKWVAGGKQDCDIIIGCLIDKDGKQTTGWTYNPNKHTEPRLIEGFGSLWLNEKDEVGGEGRMFYYFQVAFGDDCDGYRSNCFSDVKYGPKAAFKDLSHCKTDAEAFTALVKIYKKLYPEPKVVTTFRGDILIDHMYVFQELATLALMLRKPGDFIDVKAVCQKLGVSFE